MNRDTLSHLAAVALISLLTISCSGDNEDSQSLNPEDYGEHPMSDSTATDTTSTDTLGTDTVTASGNEIINQNPKSSPIYFWAEGNMPHITEYTGPQGNYQDPPSFRPYMNYFPAQQQVKGAVVVCAGGAFMFRSDSNEGTPVAQWFARHGYQAFVVNYRVRPYTMEEGSLDLARAIRYIRWHAADYGIDPNDIASVGFSAGGILCGDEALHYDELVNGTALDSRYQPDALDSVSANVCTIGMIYSFYGRLSYGTTDVELLKSGNLPPTFYAYGDLDPFYEQFLANAAAVREAGVEVEQHEYANTGHGFGYTIEDWMVKFDTWMENIMQNN
ncbi:MAG: alpha/beta hydrolase [Prevotella sp.]|jgi:acetyl esterase/lipase